MISLGFMERRGNPGFRKSNKYGLSQGSQGKSQLRENTVTIKATFFTTEESENTE